MSLINSIIAGPTRTLLSASEGVASFFGATWMRFASKKTGGSSRNHAGVVNPKHRGIKYSPGRFVQKGTLLVTQNKLRFHPGLNVGMGKNGTLFALIPGRITISMEKIDPNMEHSWNQRVYGGRELDRINKKYFHILPEPDHYRFKRIG